MPIAEKKSMYQALVNLSVGHVERGLNGREERADLVEKGSTVELTQKEAAAFGRFVRPVEDAESPMPKFTAKSVVGKQSVPAAPTLEGTAAIDMTNKSEIILNEEETAERDASIQPE